MSFTFVLAASLSALYATLDPTSVSQHFAFYELYPDTEQGKEAIQHAWDLLSGGCMECNGKEMLPTIDLVSLVQFINRSGTEEFKQLQEKEISVIQKLSRHLLNRNLAGFGLWDLNAILSLPSEKIDLARGLLLAELGPSEESRTKILSYEASLDLMALQIYARLPINATAKEKIRAISNYIFSEMRFRFPPQSLHAKEIDTYTFLPSVLDRRRGVCLGVSILYLCLAQRLGLELEAITPPGHIYVRHVEKSGEITNIETTARGIDVPSEMYLGIETRKLQKRSLKQVIGLAFVNQAAVSWHRKDHETAVALYEKARPFMGDDYLLNTLLGLNYLFVGKEKEGKALLEKIRGVIPEHAVVADSISSDYLAKRADIEAIQAIFTEIDETRGSILEKQKKLQEIVQKFPHFQQGFFHLAITWLQLGREKEAIPLLEKCLTLNSLDPTAHYYLAAIQLQRRHYNKAWHFLKKAEEIVFAKDHRPKALKELRQALERACPEP